MLDRCRAGLLLFVLVLSYGTPFALAQEIDAGRRAALEGNAAYEAGDFDRAVAHYEQALAEGFEHAIVRYNLGNAHYKRGELGSAIANYARAQRARPRDADIRQNLDRARSQIRDRELSSHELPPVLKPIGWVYRALSLDEWARTLLTLVALVCLISIAGHWNLGPARWRRRVTIAACGLGVLVALVLAGHYRTEVLRESGVVVVEEIDVRSGPGSDYNLAFQIHEGLQVRVAERRGDWLRIDLGGELVGWVPAHEVEIL